MQQTETLQPLPLREEDSHLRSLYQMPTVEFWGTPVLHWQAKTLADNTLNLFFYKHCLDVEYFHKETRGVIVYSFAGIEPGLTKQEVLDALGLTLRQGVLV